MKKVALGGHAKVGHGQCRTEARAPIVNDKAQSLFAMDTGSPGEYYLGTFEDFSLAIDTGLHNS